MVLPWLAGTMCGCEAMSCFVSFPSSCHVTAENQVGKSHLMYSFLDDMQVLGA